MRLATNPVRLQSLRDGHVDTIESTVLAYVVPENLGIQRDILCSEMLGAKRYPVAALPVGSEAFVAGPHGLDHYRRVS
jgi:hypothetical protein